MPNCAIEVMVLRDERRVLPTVWSVSDELWKLSVNELFVVLTD